jgi:hypothetical protein
VPQHGVLFMSEKEALALATIISNLSDSIVLSQVLSPDWDSSHPEWQSFVPGALRVAWEGLSLETRLLVYATACVAFDRSDLH